MTMSFRRYVTLDVIGIATMNCTINAGYVGWLWRSSASLPLAGTDGIAFDLAATPVWIAVLTTLFGTRAVQRKLWEGRFREPGRRIPGMFQLLPTNILWRVGAMGVLAGSLFALPLWLALHAAPMETLPIGQVIATKVALTAVFSALIVPLVVLAAIADMRPRRAADFVELSASIPLRGDRRMAVIWTKEQNDA